MKEDEIGRRSAAHVRSVSHGAGGGHAHTLRRFNTQQGRRSRMNPGLPVMDSWDHSGDDINPFEQDMSDLPGTEWPKWVYPEGKPPLIVQNADEEARVMGTQDEKSALVAQAEELGIKIDGRWSIERLKTEIAEKAA